MIDLIRFGYVPACIDAKEALFMQKLNDLKVVLTMM